MRCPSFASKPLAALLLFGTAVAPARAELHFVLVEGFSYNPSELTVRPGDVVQFEASGSHPLRSDDNLFECGVDCQVPFLTTGDFGFFCFSHGGPGGNGMSGTIHVVNPDRIFGNGFEAPN